MKILVLSDTHGHLGLINTLVEKHGADAVVHCGDFGLETAARLDETPRRELALRIRHASPSCGLPDSAKKACFKMNRNEKIELIKKHSLLGEFDAFLSGEKKFLVPVYCVWGNHEDDDVVQKLIKKELIVPNLHLVNAASDILLDGWIRLVGVGGNLIHWLFFDKETASPSLTAPSRPNTPIPPVTSFYPSMRFSEWVQLFDRFQVATRHNLNKQNTNNNENNNENNNNKDEKNNAESSSSKSNKGKRANNNQDNKSKQAGKHDKEPGKKEQLWVVTHLSAGKEAMLEWFLYLIGPAFVFSGHMGPYLPQHYTMFTVMDDQEWLERVKKDLSFVRSVWKERSWGFKLWHFANGLLEQGDVELTDPTSPIKTEWSSLVEDSIQRGETNIKLADMHWEENVVQKLNSAPTSHALANAILDQFLKIKQEEDSVNLPSSKTKSSLPNPTIIPDKATLTWLSEKVEQFLVVPAEKEPKKKGDDVNEAFLRKPCDLVKQSPQYFNLPDAYMGGYVLVDTNAENQTLTFTTIGTYPPSHYLS